MYFPYFITYIAIGLIISIVVFIWALRNGQFRDQQRARFLPLEDRQLEGSVKLTRKGRWQAIILLVMACSGLVATAAAIVISLIVAGGPSR